MEKRKDSRAYNKVQLTPYMVEVAIREREKYDCLHPNSYQDDADSIHRCILCHTIVDPDELDWKFEDDPDGN